MLSKTYSMVRCRLKKDGRVIMMWLPTEWCEKGREIKIEGEEGWIVDRTFGLEVSSCEIAKFVKEVEDNEPVGQFFISGETKKAG